MLVTDPTTVAGEITLIREEWALLNRFCPGVGRYQYWQSKWGLMPDQLYDLETYVHDVHML